MKQTLFLVTLFLSMSFGVLSGDGSWSQRSALNDVLVGIDYSMISPTWGNQEPAVYANRVGLIHLDYTRKNQSDLTFGNEWRIFVTVEYKLEGSSDYVEKDLEISFMEGFYQYSDYEKFGVPLNGYSAHVRSISGEWNDGNGNWTSVLNAQNDPHFPVDIDFRLELKEEVWYELSDINAVNGTAEFSNLNFDGTDFRAHWGYFEGAEQYDFEWVWIDKESSESNDLVSGIPPLGVSPESWPFELKEPSRVRVCHTNHRLDKTYAEGTLYFRVRGVSKYLDGSQGVYDQIKEGEWTYFDQSNNVVSHVITGADIFEKEKNWLYGVAYAEDGKNVSSVTFYDGSNRGRQSLTYNTSDDITLIGESKFDFEGRQTVSVVPAPVKGRSLGYRTLFNRAFDESEFDEQDFDLSYFNATATATSPISLSQPLASTVANNSTLELGAAQYFSEDNQFDEDLFQAAIPNANGYVYSQTVYRNDGTGRIEEVGGIGQTFQVGGDHSVKTYYGSTNVVELQRLFGSNVSTTPEGYRKEMVRDANGQHSVTYYDKRGNVIATALSGNSPTSLLPLEDQDPIDVVTSLNDNNIAVDNYTMVSEHTFLNSIENQTISLDYSVNGIVNQLTTTPVDVNGHTVLLGDFCSTCRYDLTIEVLEQNGEPVDEVNNIYGDSTSVPFTISVDPSGNCYDASGAVDSSATGIAYSTPSLEYFLEDIGEYRIIKTLSVDQEDMQAAFDAQLELSGANDPTAFIDDYLSNIDISGCFTNCDDYCYWFKKFEYDQKFGVGSWMALDTLIKLDSMAACTANVCDVNEMFENFDSETAGGNPVISPIEQGCQGYRLQMLSQISPGGVYYDTPLSGFWVDVALNAPVNISGVNYTLAQLQDSASFIPEMAEALLVYHREFCHLDDCNDWASTMDYSNALTLEINETAWPATQDPTSGSVFDKPYTPSPSIVTPLQDYGTTSPMGDPFLGQAWSSGGDLETSVLNYYDYLLNSPAGLPTLCGVSSTFTSGAPAEFGSSNSSLFHYVNHVVNCIEQDNENTLPNPILLSSEYYNYQRRLMFKGIYDQIKMELIAAWQVANGCPYQTDVNAVFMGPPNQAEMEQAIAGSLSGVVNSTNCAAQAYVNTVDWIGSIDSTCLTGLANSTPSAHNIAFGNDPAADQATLIAGGTATIEQLMYDYVLATCPTNPLGLFFNPDVNDVNFDPSDSLSPASQTATEPGEAEYIGVYQLLISCDPTLVPPSFETTPPQTNVLNTTSQSLSGCFLEYMNMVNDGIAELNANPQPVTPCSVPNIISCEGVQIDITASGNYPVLTGVCGLNGVYKFFKKTFNDGTFVYEFGIDSSDCLFKLYFNGSINSIASLAPLASISNPAIQTNFNTVTFDLNFLDGTTVVGEAYVLKSQTPCLFKSDTLNNNNQTITFPNFPDTLPDYESDCIESTLGQAAIDAKNAYNAILNDLQNQFQESMSNCIASASENFTMSYKLKEYQYTLYYYDLAGNLVQTVPPQGVHPIDMSHFSGGVWDNFPVDHSMETRYKYNGLNTLIAQYTPDGGHSDFVLDELYRVRYSQNARQSDEERGSYTQYDELGRITEAGEFYMGSLALGASLSLNDLDGLVSDNNFPSTTRKMDYTITHYEDVYASDPSIALMFTDGEQKNLRNTIGAIEHVQTGEIGSITTQVVQADFRTVISYSYDPHKNVQEMVSTNYQLESIGQQHKTVRYDYDLISGNVNELIYQEDRNIQLNETLGQEQEELYGDEYRHKYHYDANNRLIRAFTSKDGGTTWDKEAKYFYYLHGALARTELGEDEVQGTDYAYNLQGWLKGVNASSLVTSRDLGGDADTGLNKYFGADAHGFMLSYFDGDYQSIETTSAFANINAVIAQNIHPTTFTAAPSNLYNGNIHNMVTAMRNTDEEPIDVLSNNYQYDQLQRIRSMKVYYSDNLMANNNFSGASLYNGGAYRTSYEFDKNGNLKHLSRFGFDGSKKMDEFTYQYYTDPTFHTNNGATIGNNAISTNPSESNRLAQVQDVMSLTNNYDDIDIDFGQNGSNYEYDASGQLKMDEQEGIDEIVWSVTGKVKEIKFTTAAKAEGKKDLKFVYDPMDMRVMKIEYLDGQNRAVKYTYYSSDAQGNVLATYTRLIQPPTIIFGDGTSNYDYDDVFKLDEHMIYGSSRLGVSNRDVLLTSSRVSYLQGSNPDIELSHKFTWANTVEHEHIESQRIVGHKYYELSNHLGNVLEVISDHKVGIPVNGSFIYSANVVSFSDYYPYGMLLPSMGEDDCGGDIVVEEEVETTVLVQKFETEGDTEGWVQYGTSGITIESFGGNLVVNGSIISGGTSATAVLCAQKPVSYSAGTYKITLDITSISGDIGFIVGELSNQPIQEFNDLQLGTNIFVFTSPVQIGNLLFFYKEINSPDYYLSLDQILIEEITTELVSYPCHLAIRSGSETGDDYRYSFQGQESDDEVKGKGNSVNYKYRMHDPRIGRFFAVDPLTSLYSHYTPYSFSGNKVISAIELEGLEEVELTPYQNYQRGLRLIKAVNKKMVGLELTYAYSLEHKQVNQETAMQKLQEAKDVRVNIYKQTYKHARNAEHRQRLAHVFSHPEFEIAVTQEKALEFVHIGLDVIGLIPVLGEPADGVNGIIYYAEGKRLEAGLSWGAMIPIAGWFATGAKWTHRIVKHSMQYGDEASTLVQSTIKKLDDAGNAKKEIFTLTKSGSFKDAKTVIGDVVGDLGDDATDYVSKTSGPFKNKVVGKQSADGSRYWRVDWDADNGAHINWVNGKQKGSIPFTGDLEQAQRVVNNTMGN